MKRKKIVILGSTGSIGINTLKVVEKYPDYFEIIGLSAYSSLKLFEKQILKFKPKFAALSDKGISHFKRKKVSKHTKFLNVDDDLEDLVARKEVDAVVIGMRSSAALKPFLSAVRASKLVAPANKEALVIAGDILMEEARKNKATIIPVDSEQSAIFQCLEGQNESELKRIHLTASGGALLNVKENRFGKLTVKEILDHPRWKMGKKITVDSATLMNKGFEVIEAQRLFNLKFDQINVVVHPQAIIHSMVEFIDGSVIAQLGITDMRLPIQYALTYPKRLSTGLPSLDFTKLAQLNFEKPDLKKFPALELCFFVAKKGKTFPSVLNAADEVAVDAFLKEEISFLDIYKVVEKVVLKHKVSANLSLEEIINADQWARHQARKVISQL